MTNKKEDLSNKLLNLVLRELPIETMTRGTQEDAKEYVEILTDSMSAVMARLVVAYMGYVMATKQEDSEEEIVSINNVVHECVSKHMDFEAEDLAKNISGKPRIDA